MPEISDTEDHFDLMIENPDLVEDEHSLSTWQMAVWPFARHQRICQLPAHRIAWLDLEGPVSGERGFVKRVCRGQCHVLSRTSDQWIVRFQTVDLVPHDPELADAWPGNQMEVELVLENCGDLNIIDYWQISVRQTK